MIQITVDPGFKIIDAVENQECIECNTEAITDVWTICNGFKHCPFCGRSL